MNSFFLTPNNIAVLILTFFAGLFIAKLFKARGIGGCLTYFIGFVLLIILISALVKGYSYFFERITYNLETYIAFNAIGILGVFIGFIFGLLIFSNK